MIREYCDLSKAIVLVGILLMITSCDDDPVQITPDPSAGGGGVGVGGATGIADASSPDTSSPDTNGPDADAAPDSGRTELVCPPNAKGTKQVLLTTTAGPSFCIDQMETTRSQYKEFLDAKGTDLTGQPPECAYNESYSPPFPDPDPLVECPESAWSLEQYPDLPVVCVDFCDAFAYCKWAGKRLCGQVGESGDVVQNVPNPSEVGGSSQSEWSYACSNGGKTLYPYGDEYVEAACIDKARIDVEGTTAGVPKMEGESCKGTEQPFDQIYHLSGSVSEWTNICKSDAFRCVNLGGSSLDEGGDQLTCTLAPLGSTISHRTPGVGFRCCADPVEVPAR